MIDDDDDDDDDDADDADNAADDADYHTMDSAVTSLIVVNAGTSQVFVVQGRARENQRQPFQARAQQTAIDRGDALLLPL